MIGARVRQVRELLGWTQGELSERAGLTQGAVSLIETGRITPSSQTVAAIVGATGFGEAWLHRDGLIAFPEGTFRFRKKANASVRSGTRARRRLEVVFELVHELRQGLRLPPIRLPMNQPPAVREDIEVCAAEVREALGLAPSGPVAHLMRAAERAGVLFVGLPFEHEGHDGVSVWLDVDEIPMVGYKPNGVGDRQRLTVAHELGHLVLHSVKTGEHPEQDAFHFAGALLVPYEDAREALVTPLTLSTLTRLKSVWGVSIQALIQRAASLGLMGDDHRRSLYKQLSARGWRRQEPVEVGREDPKMFAKIITARFGPLPDLTTVAGNLGIPVFLLGELLGDSTRDGTPGQIIRLSSRLA